MISYGLDRKNQKKGLNLIRNIIQKETVEILEIKELSFGEDNKLLLKAELLDETQRIKVSINLINFRLENDCVLCIRFDFFEAKPQWLYKIVEMYLDGKKCILVDEKFKNEFDKVKGIFDK